MDPLEMDMLVATRLVSLDTNWSGTWFQSMWTVAVDFDIEIHYYM